ncbi:hypothetical protein AMATHDRAFT_50188 [Amanita thiersii Skay4041]|uniref:Uncharacterized protein n=1 Tax=Amanita thiersii Skay4041 TaxID=703135 RepID=A0A2A9NAF5_9AGAR|nr:hypothetical protein AMATHDRAFT_50188 [Amanita thiersii Skay4041]
MDFATSAIARTILFAGIGGVAAPPKINYLGNQINHDYDAAQNAGSSSVHTNGAYLAFSSSSDVLVTRRNKPSTGTEDYGRPISQKSSGDLEIGTYSTNSATASGQHSSVSSTHTSSLSLDSSASHIPSQTRP